MTSASRVEHASAGTGEARLGLRDYALPVAIAVVWAGLVATAYFLREMTGSDIQLCLFRRMTGVPCPTCGSTRAVVSLAQGHPIDALAFNPMMVAGGLSALIWLVVCAVNGPSRRPPWSMRARRWAWVLGVAIVLGNWVWVLWHEGTI